MRMPQERRLISKECGTGTIIVIIGNYHRKTQNRIPSVITKLVHRTVQRMFGVVACPMLFIIRLRLECENNENLQSTCVWESVSGNYRIPPHKKFLEECCTPKSRVIGDLEFESAFVNPPSCSVVGPPPRTRERIALQQRDRVASKYFSSCVTRILNSALTCMTVLSLLYGTVPYCTVCQGRIWETQASALRKMGR